MKRKELMLHLGRTLSKRQAALRKLVTGHAALAPSYVRSVGDRADAAVDSEQDEMDSQMVIPDSNRWRTILFVDVVASVELYADLGDTEARARMAPCLHQLSSLIESHGGTIVKSLGDGIMAAFDRERDAVGAAMGMPACASGCGLQRNR